MPQTSFKKTEVHMYVNILYLYTYHCLFFKSVAHDLFKHLLSGWFFLNLLLVSNIRTVTRCKHVLSLQVLEAMTTTWSFGLPANLPVMTPWLPFHDPRGVAVAEVMRMNASRGAAKGGRFSFFLKGVMFSFFWGGGKC